MQAGLVDEVARGVRRILAPNPSPMTGPGTNSYILGSGGPLLVIDPGPGIETHLEALLSAPGPGETISAIVVTHAHLDHSAGARRLARRCGAPILAFGQAGSARTPLMTRLFEEGLSDGGEGVDAEFTPDRFVRDGEVLSGAWGALRVIHTPGHMAEHICLALGDVLFSGDHAMGWSTSLVSPPDGDMGAYMASLDRLMAEDWSLMLPGHGAEVRPVAARLSELHRHRKMREHSILGALSEEPAHAFGLAKRLYTDTPPPLLPAAARNILAHLIDLHERKLIQPDGRIHAGTIFSTIRTGE